MSEHWAVKSVAEAQAISVERTFRLRTAEKLALLFFSYVIVAALIARLSARERLTLVGLNLIAVSLLLALSSLGRETRGQFFEKVRDWLPCVLILLAYRESGLFLTPDPTHRLDHLFVRWDWAVLKHRWVVGVLSLASPWLQQYLEICYFLCYPLVPLGLGSLSIALQYGDLGRRSAGEVIDHFWTAVLSALFFCYLIFPLFPLTPPRILFHDLPGPPVDPIFRMMNSWILGQYSVQACIFPSGHVAGVTATALAVRRYLPRVGAVLTVAALSVAAATVYGRYHYAADAVAGALVGIAAVLISNRVHPRE